MIKFVTPSWIRHHTLQVTKSLGRFVYVCWSSPQSIADLDLVWGWNSTLGWAVGARCSSVTNSFLNPYSVIDQCYFLVRRSKYYIEIKCQAHLHVRDDVCKDFSPSSQKGEGSSTKGSGFYWGNDVTHPEQGHEHMLILGNDRELHAIKDR